MICLKDVLFFFFTAEIGSPEFVPDTATGFEAQSAAREARL